MAIDVTKTIRRYSELRSQRVNFDSVNQEIADFMVPNKAGITRQIYPGEKTMARVFDSTAIEAIHTLAASMHGTLTNPATLWFSLRPRQKAWEQIEGMLDWLEALGEAYYSALGDSNFSADVVEFYHEAISMGCGVQFQDEKVSDSAAFGGLYFKTLCFGEYVLGEDRYGEVDTVMREYTMARRIAYELWGEKLEDRASERARSQPDEHVRILHVVMPRADKYYGGARDSLSLPWASCNLSLGASTGNMAGAGPDSYGEPHLLDEGGYHTFPYAVFRWSKLSREVYGRGPGRTALPDVKTLNRLVALNLSALAKEVDPPILQRHEAVIGGLSLTPASVNVVDFDGPLADAVSPLESKRHHDWTSMEIAGLQQKIRQIFFANQLELQEKPAMTATEVSVRYEMMQRLLGPALGRLKYEFLQRLIERGLSLLAEAGALPPMPPAVQEVIGQIDIDVRFEGPLERAQRSHALIAIERKNQWAAMIGQMKPEVWDTWDFDKEAREVSEITGVPADLVREESDIKRIRQARAQAQQQMNQMMLAGQVAEAAGKAAPMVKALKEPDENAQEVAAP